MTKKKKEPLGHALLILTRKSKHYIKGVLVCSKVFRNDDDMSLSKVHEALGDEAAGHIKPIFTKSELEAAEAEALQYQTAMTG